LTVDDIHSVEMIGDASRTPVILDITKQVFGRETMRTLNSVECLAKGAALQAAMLNPTFSVSSFVVEEFNSLPVQICYQFDGEQDQKVKELFTVGSMFPLTKTVTFDNKLGGVKLLISYDINKQAILKGLPDQIAGYQIKNGKPKHADSKHGNKVKFTMRIVNDLNQIPRLGGADFTEEWTEEVQVPVKKPVAPKPAEPAKPEEKPAEGAEAPKEGEQPKEPVVEKP
jgi:heat shock 70kDa protein 4